MGEVIWGEEGVGVKRPPNRCQSTTKPGATNRRPRGRSQIRSFYVALCHNWYARYHAKPRCLLLFLREKHVCYAVIGARVWRYQSHMIEPLR
jgi:hypothetical protein